MKVVERYIMRRAFLLFVGALCWTLAIAWTTQVLARIDLVTDSGQSALTFFEVAALIIPTIIPIVVPFAMAGSAAQTLSVMNGDSELVVISAAGASRSVVVKPILILAVLASVLSLVVQNGVEPYARQRNRDLIASSRADFLSLILQEGTFRKVDDGLFVQIGERLPGDRLAGIFVADSRQSGIDLIYYAKSGAVIDQDNEKVLLMNDGVVQRKTLNGDVSVVHFTSYAFDLSTFDADTSGVTLLPKDRTTRYLLNPDPNDPRYQRDPYDYSTELHKRFSEWMLPFAFALIALAVAGDARSHREARIHPLITTIGITLVVRWIVFFIEGQAKTHPSYAYGLYVVPIATSVIAFWFISTQRTMELPRGWTDAISAFAQRLNERASAFKMRLKSRLTGAGKGAA